MEYQGIVTGIGDKDTKKNLIKPEYDAVLNDFIIGKNTILEGLVLNGKNISAGTCILCGYRGIIDTPKDLDNTAYVYGEFTLNSIYGGSGEDSFEIVGFSTELTENVNPIEITSAGTYYLLLYANGEKQVDIYEENGEVKELGEYPLKAQYSVETEKVLDGAEIESEVEGVTQLPNDNSNRISTTQYVHNQIEEEIDYGTAKATLYIITTGNTNTKTEYGTITLYRKSKYVIGKVEVDKASLDTALAKIREGVSLTVTAKYSKTRIEFVDGYIPAEDISLYLPLAFFQLAQSSIQIQELSVSEQVVSISADSSYIEISLPTDNSNVPNDSYIFTANIGYQCR